ncbi:LOW QUALITY PROTEIN: hypothetical protein JCM19053_4135 [Vibrio sp. JCM 19053]|nr:LOW QUALITY PROTEIN: hypothetical protein JCM19053_4135 [Vibrio sp. JCM 19053]
MISFGSVSALQAAMPQARNEILNEGKLSIGGKEYQINAATQEFTRTNPTNGAVARFFSDRKIFREGSSQSVAKALTKAVFDNEQGQAQRLRAASSVEHGQMFFKDGNIKTASDVLNAFAKLDSKTVQSHSAELNQLAERAMTESMLETDSGKNLTSLIGESAAKSLAGRVVKDYGGGVSAAQKNPAGSITQMQAVFDMEVMHLKSAQRHIEGLASTDLSKVVYAEGLAEDAFNKSGVTDNVERAAAWIINASNSKGNDAENITSLLKEYASNGKDLLNMENLKELHARLVPDVERDYRGPNISGGTLPSSIGGEGMLKQHIEGFLKENPVEDKDLGKHLFAGVIGYHGFTDGNGRMGRMLYAIAELRNDSFNPLAMDAENSLHGIK